MRYKIPKIRTLRIYIAFFCCISFPSFVFAQKTMSLNEARNMIINNHIREAVDGYSQLVAKDSTNASLLAEYSYVLALNGAFDCALMNLDRVRLFSPNLLDGQFYTSLVFALMGYDELSDEFGKIVPVNKRPQWISEPQCTELLNKYKRRSNINKDDYPKAFIRVNQLTASGLYLQSTVLYEEMIEEEPRDYFPHLGYSIVLEKLNLYSKAAQELDIAIQMMGNTPEEVKAKEVFEKRKIELADKMNSPQKLKNKWFKLKNEFNPQTMLYVGGMITESYLSIDSRFGLFLNNTFNGAVDLGVSGSDGDVNANFGLSGYKRFGVFVWGEGLNLQVGNSTTTFSLKSSAGLSFINRKRNSSWDIFFDYFLPLGNGKSSYGISIGKTIYFGKR